MSTYKVTNSLNFTEASSASNTDGKLGSVWL